MTSVSKLLSFSRTFKLLCSGLGQQGPGDKPLRWKKSVCPVDIRWGQNTFIWLHFPDNPGGQEGLCLWHHL